MVLHTRQQVALQFQFLPACSNGMSSYSRMCRNISLIIGNVRPLLEHQSIRTLITCRYAPKRICNTVFTCAQPTTKTPIPLLTVTNCHKVDTSLLRARSFRNTPVRVCVCLGLHSHLCGACVFVPRRVPCVIAPFLYAHYY